MPIGKKMSNNRLNRFLNGKGFYFVLGVCMIAIGVSAWTAIDKASAPSDNILSSDTAEQNSKEEPFDFEKEAKANKEQSGIEDERDEINSREQEESKENSYEKEQSSKEEQSSSTLEKPEVEPLASYFVFPIQGEVIKKFSASEVQYSVTFNDMRLHKGVDIKAVAGSEVKSAGDGKILEVKKDPDLGYTVKIDHGNGITVLYAGLQKEISVKENEVVLAGATLGKLGTVNNECLDAPHLHLEFFNNGEAVDPLNYLN